MKIALACDHGGLLLKEALIPFLRSLGHAVEDFGTYSMDSCDYPDYAIAAAQSVAEGDCDRGIVICTTGIGVSIAANKVSGIRCALLSDLDSARMTRLHNDTNMMALGAAIVSRDLAFAIVETWLSTPFSNEDRHRRRIDKMMSCERSQKKKQRRNNQPRRRHNSTLLGKLLTAFISVLLVVSLLLTPIATFITNMTDPAQLVERLFASGVFDSEEPTEDPSAGTEVPTEDVTEAPTEESTQSSTEAGTDPDVNSENTDASTQDDALSTAAEESADIPADGDNLETITEDSTEAPTEEATEAPTEEATEVPTEENTEVPTEESAEAPTEKNTPSYSSAADALFGSLKDMIGSDMMCEDTLNAGLNLPDGSTIDTNKLGNDLLESAAAQALVQAYMTDAINSAAGMEGDPSLTSDSAMSIVTPHIDELTDIVAGCLPEGMEIDRAALEELTLQALEASLPAIVDALPNVGEVVNALGEESPVLGVVLKSLKFIRIGGLRASALLAVVAFAVILCLFRLPGLRGLRCVGVCSMIGAALCGALYLLLSMPMLTAHLEKALDEYGAIISDFSLGFAHEYAVCAVIFGVIGLVFFLGTTILRGFFSALFGAIFSRD